MRHASSARKVLATLLAAAPMLVIGAAGLMKLVDVPRFELAIRAWTVVPDAAASWVAMLVPACELLVAVMWAFSVRPRAVLWSSAAMLAAFSVVLAAEWFAAGPPTCACLGLLGDYLDRMNEAKFSLIRNGVMIAMLLTSLAMTRNPSGGDRNVEGVVQPEVCSGVHAD